MKSTIRTAGAVLCVMFALTVGAACGQSSEEFEIYELVNRERAKQHLAELEWDNEVANLAREYSRQMAGQGFFGHYDSRGRTVVDRAAERRIRGWSRIGENLFMCDEFDGFEPYSVRGWLKSASHRRNMFDRGWSATGIGVYRSRDGRIYVTQVFIA